MVGLIQRPVHQAVSPDKALPGSDSTSSFHFILYILAMFLIKYNFGKLVNISCSHKVLPSQQGWCSVLISAASPLPGLLALNGMLPSFCTVCDLCHSSADHVVGDGLRLPPVPTPV